MENYIWCSYHLLKTIPEYSTVHKNSEERDGLLCHRHCTADDDPQFGTVASSMAQFLVLVDSTICLTCSNLYVAMILALHRSHDLYYPLQETSGGFPQHNDNQQSGMKSH